MVSRQVRIFLCLLHKLFADQKQNILLLLKIEIFIRCHKNAGVMGCFMLFIFVEMQVFMF